MLVGLRCHIRSECGLHHVNFGFFLAHGLAKAKLGRVFLCRGQLTPDSSNAKVAIFKINWTRCFTDPGLCIWYVRWHVIWDVPEVRDVARNHSDSTLECCWRSIFSLSALPKPIIGAVAQVEDACSPTELTTPYCAGPIVQDCLGRLFLPTFFPPKLKLGWAFHVETESLAIS